MSENVIFCFSGSGNSLDIAKNIAGQLGDTDIVMMRRAPAIKNVVNYKTVGFVFPCYAGGLPGDVEKYVASLNVNFSSYTYAVVTYAGYPGIGLKKINSLVPLDYWGEISHRCSCIWLMPPSLMLPPLSAKKAQARSEKLAKKIAEDVKNRVQSEGIPPENALNKIESSAWPMLSKKKAEAFSVDETKCSKCGLCETICPKHNIITGDKKFYPSFGKNCIGCLSCLQYCPNEAINIGKASIKRKRYHNANIKASELNQDVIHIN